MTSTETPPGMKRVALTIKELAKLLGVAESTIRMECQEGRIEGAVKRGRIWTIPVTWIEKTYNIKL